MSAALVATTLVRMGFFSAMGIVCGWQPMPDGSASYECVVQVEPQLLDALRRGDSIPLSVEIPAHVRPISRVRLVVGEGDVPQEQLADAPKKSLDGVVHTQFTTSNNTDSRYNSQAPGAQVVPANEYVTNSQDAFARSLQNGGKAVRSAVSEIAQDVLPPDAGRGMAGAVDRAGQALGNNLRNAGETVREDIRQLFGTESAAGSNSEILPPEAQRTPGLHNPPSQQILPADPGTANNRRRLDQPLNSTQPGDWQSRATGETASAGGANNSPANAQHNVRNGSDPPFSVSDSNILPRNDSGQTLSSNNSPVDRYGSYTTQQSGGAALANNRTAETANNQSSAAGPSFPPFSPSVRDQSITPTPQSSSSVVEIRRDMLDKPANAEIQGANGLPIGQQPITQTANAPTAADFNWNSNPQSQPTQTPPITSQPVAAQTATPPAFPLLLSWVLLSGSGAGNLYLFWSYLDVRNKYEDLLGASPRNRRARFSGRRERAA